MLTKLQKSQLRQLVQSPQFGAFEQLAEELCAKIKDDSAIKASEWETMKELLTKEGQVIGIKRFLQEIFLHIQDDQ